MATILKRRSPVIDDNGHVILDLDDGQRVYVGYVDGDNICFPRMIGTDKTWPMAWIVSVSDGSRYLRDSHDTTSAARIVINDGSVRISRDAYCSEYPMDRPTPRKIWPHGLIIDDAGVVTFTVPEDDAGINSITWGNRGSFARVGYIEVLPPGESIVFDDPVRRKRDKHIRQRLYMDEIVACSWDYEIHGLYIVDKAGRVHRYRAIDVPANNDATMYARDPEILRAVDELMETTRHGDSDGNDESRLITTDDLCDHLGMDDLTAHATLMIMCHDKVLERAFGEGMYANFRRYDPSHQMHKKIHYNNRDEKNPHGYRPRSHERDRVQPPYPPMLRVPLEAF